MPEATEKLIQSGFLEKYLGDHLGDAKRHKFAEKLLKQYGTEDKEKAAWKLGYLLSGKALFFYNNHFFATKGELYRHVIEWTNGMTIEAAHAVAEDFERTAEFCAWEEWEEENK